jgi:hypothetical protein
VDLQEENFLLLEKLMRDDHHQLIHLHFHFYRHLLM